MKKLVLLLILMQSLLTIAQAPQKMSYQAVIRNSGGALVVNQVVGMKISVLQGSTSGTAVFAETHTPTTNANGLVSLEIGTGSPVNGTLAGVNWANGPYYIQSQIDVTGGTNYTLTGAYQLLSVPYALYAANGLPPGNNAGEMMFWNGTSWVNVPPGQTGQTLTFCYNSPQWGPCKAQVTTLPIRNITGYTAESGGQILNNGGSTITSSGICWSTSENPTINDFNNIINSTPDTFNLTLNNLIVDTTYYVRAFVINSSGITYGNQLSFNYVASEPTISSTINTTNISFDSALLSGNIISDSGSPITNSGFCWSTSSNPTIASNKLNINAGIGSLNGTISGLNINTTYYVKAFATNNKGTVYSNEISLSTRIPNVGDYCQGGQVVYILQETDPGFVAGETHGLIRSLNLQNKSWGCWGFFMGTTSNDFGTGESNTIEIVNNCSGDTAAKYCFDLVENGYSDWFLPSLNELKKFSYNVINHQQLWSSSEISSTNSYIYGEGGYSYTTFAPFGGIGFAYVWNGYNSQFNISKGNYQPFYPVRRF